MEHSISLTIVSPESLVLKDTASMVVLPGSEGDFGILPNHAPVVSSLRPGLLKIYENDTVKEMLFISGGFANVSERACTILVEESHFIKDMSLDDLEEHLRNSSEDLEMARTEEEHKEYTHTHKLLLAKIEILRKLKR
jgi:F-type H+-transporting ATPase subunit epsilon